MSSQTYSITITSKATGVKESFDLIKKGADSDVVALQKLGREGSASLKQVDQSAKTTGQSMSDLTGKAKAVGTGLGVLTAAASLTGRAFQSQEQSLSSLRRSYGDSSQQIIDFTESLQDAGIASNDMGRDAAQTAATLVRNFGFTADEIQKVIKVSADLAAANPGTSLIDATERVVAGLRGETESAEALGLALNQQTIDREGLTLTMSNQEAAHFRLNAVLEQSAFAEGAAAEKADGAAGAARKLTFELQDLVQSAGGMIGPIGEVASVLGSVALAAPLAGAGLGKVLGAGSALIGGTEAVAGLGGALVALGPAALIAAGGIAAVAIAVHEVNAVNQEGEDRVNRQIEFVARLSDAYKQEGREILGFFENFNIAAQLTTPDGRSITMNVQDLTDELLSLPVDQITRIIDEANSLGLDWKAPDPDLLDIVAQDIYATAFAWNASGLAAKDASNLTIEAIAAMAGAANKLGPVIAAQEKYNDLLKAHAEQTVKGSSSLEAANAALTLSYADSAAGQQVLADLDVIRTQGTDQQRAAAQKLYDQMKLSIFGEKLYADSVHVSALFIQDQTDRKLAAAEAEKELAAAQKSRADLLKASTPQAIEDAKQLNVQGDRWAALAAEGVWDQSGQLIGTKNGLAAAKEELKAATDAAIGYATALVGASSLASNLRPLDLSVTGGDKAVGAAADLQSAGAGLDSVLGIFNDIDQMGSKAGQAGSIAEKLIGKPGELGKIDELWSATLEATDKNTISHKRYLMTVEAGNNIMARTADVQSDLAVIQAKQLPFLDEASAKYSDLIDDVAHMGTQQQAAALGFMDANESMKAQSAIALATAAANTEVGSAARESTEAIIAGAVATDPYLEAMLTQIGLVARDHEGNLVVNFDNADTLKSSTDALTNAVIALTSSLNGIPPNVNIDITANDYASGVAQYVAQVMAGLSGTSVTTTIYMDYVARGDGTQMAGGGIVTAAGGRLVNDLQRIRVNEGGQEMATLPTGDDVWLPTGSTVWPHSASVMRDQSRGGGGGGRAFNNYGTIHIHANDPGDFMAQLRSARIAER